MRLPPGGARILEARVTRGLQPADLVVVSLCGWPEGIENPTVVPTGGNHDWGFMAGLDAVVYVKPGAQFVRETLDGLAYHAEYMALWDVESQQGVDLWPIWDGTPEQHHIERERRQGWRIKRWGRLTWLPGENRRFAA